MRRHYPILLKAALALTLIVPGPLQAQEITIKHSQGETRVATNPHTVLTLDIAALDTLDAIGVGVAGVPNTPFPPYLSKYKDERYRKIGSLFEPDYEAINALKPDLVIVGGRSSPKYAEVAKLAPTIDLSPDFKHRVAADIEHAEALGRIFNKESEVADRVGHLRATIDALRVKAATAGTGMLIMTSGGRIAAIGPGSWFGTLYDDFGVRPAATTLDSGPHGQVVSSEFILMADPDWLFVIDRDAAIGESGAAAKQILDNELVHQTKAWKSGHIVYLDPIDWYIVGDGIVSLQAMADQVISALSRPK
ncbi:MULTISPECIES: siderophore ABC transporter substrate-binding protein [Rhizobium/Agrobacterium group]|uniref:siderophore ABC transporter substrate-binding protein n=1 Tax=Rhizobium/Agrobacterium group TaxID=227290 RepID=UPI0003F20FE4|nr:MULTISPECIES: siderophore ABC transporter substrate-binding protein [Rhizobium/Agrobacterium group]AHK04903.1 iron compound ABC transporter, periplasmic iron compound-binding protein [Agrobacterium tumefaciens LBA4213 (Ach5)]AKC10631.1 iron ABC transporter substrate-binding protein [Agrobacterium tumefaciens]AYM20014.1 hypothetical protein At15955_50290 [Agrobacterium tumefaciens]AYM71317.1 hypothetical protein AtA6_51010 [Agrobacterium tumefaciens]NIB59706.1 siderophore ABC transporter sub